mmetsp:Transcript_46596/g.129877  ORF Transcript_46596/g.129877 Transcript_46596/m.129877 type:complete len:227 (+) Transcript_46596:249-929(+)
MAIGQHSCLARLVATIASNESVPSVLPSIEAVLQQVVGGQLLVLVARQVGLEHTVAVKSHSRQPLHCSVLICRQVNDGGARRRPARAARSAPTHGRAHEAGERLGGHAADGRSEAAELLRCQAHLPCEACALFWGHGAQHGAQHGRVDASGHAGHARHGGSRAGSTSRGRRRPRRTRGARGARRGCRRCLRHRLVHELDKGLAVGVDDGEQGRARRANLAEHHGQC